MVGDKGELFLLLRAKCCKPNDQSIASYTPVLLLRMFEKAASLISQLHQQGVAHCDVKLDNLLLLNGELMLSDFSEAVAFMRPEQAVLHESRCVGVYAFLSYVISRSFCVIYRNTTC